MPKSQTSQSKRAAGVRAGVLVGLGVVMIFAGIITYVLNADRSNPAYWDALQQARARGENIPLPPPDEIDGEPQQFPIWAEPTLYVFLGSLALGGLLIWLGMPTGHNDDRNANREDARQSRDAS